MNICDMILEKYDNEGYVIDEKYYHMIYNEFIKKHVFSRINIGIALIWRKLIELDYIYKSKYLDSFFNICKKYNYNMNTEIQNAIFCLTDEYYELYNPLELSVVKNMDIDREYEITLEKTNQDKDRCALLSIALYKYYLKVMEYNGALEDAPEIKQYQIRKQR